jgi:hypothetical protein
LSIKSLELPAKAFVVCPCNGSTYNDLLQYQEHFLNDSEHLDTEKQLEYVPCARLIALRKDYFNHLRGSPNHDGNVKFAKALLNLSCANDSDPGLSHPVLSRRPDLSVDQAIQKLREIGETIKDPFRSAPPAAK